MGMWRHHVDGRVVVLGNIDYLNLRYYTPAIAPAIILTK